MGVIDKFLNAMKMNDEDVLDDDYLDDDDDYEEEEDFDEPQEERPRKRILSRFREEDAARAESAEEPIQEEPRRQAPAVKQPKTSRTPRTGSSKISPMRQTSKRSGGMEVCVIKPKTIEDSREVTETLLDECTVILNMEGIDFELAQRIIDFACGSCYAIHGKLQKVSNYIFIITPPNVDISGDFQEMMSGAYSVPSFGTTF
ncbi:MAG: cell division protein SepF [Lachnospiraceae bacterium]|nr:cell division protein SepF [Lachnospiraceae bacterium]